MQGSLERFSRWVRIIRRKSSGENHGMKSFQSLDQSNAMASNRQTARWAEVDAYAHQSWAKRLPGVLLATLILTALLLWMGLPVWFFH